MKHPRLNVLGNRVGRRLHDAELSDLEVARRVGVTRAQLNRIRNGRVVPRVRTALALAAALRCRVADLFFLKAPRR